MDNELFEPIELSGITLKNRIVRAATNDYAGNFDGTISEEQIEIYRRLARENIGLLITGNFYVRNDGQLDATQNAMTEDLFIWSAKDLCRMVHRYGSKIVFQLSHAGKKNKISRETAVKYENLENLSQDFIVQILKDFVSASVRCKRAQADGIQLHFAHDYLLYDILTKLKKGLQNTELLFSMLREELADYPIFVKVSSDIEKAVLKKFGELCNKYQLSAIEVSGNDFTQKTKEEHLYYLKEAEEMRQYSGLPILLTGGIRSVEDAKRVLENGISLVGMCRPFICQPELLRTWETAPSKCISCCKCFRIYQESGYHCVNQRVR